jgi:aquaporin Z
MRKFFAEFLGTFMLVTAVCGIGTLTPAGTAPWAMALGAGLSVLAAMGAFAPISGGHFNPALTIGLAAAGRHPVSQVPGYLFAQLVGAMLAAFAWYVVASARMGGTASDLGTFLANGFDVASPGHLSLGAVALAEVLATALLTIVFATVTPRHGSNPTAPMVVGAAVTALLLLMIPIDGGGLNPARSTASALLGGPLAVSQLWLFWAAPIVGAILGGWLSRLVTTVDGRAL